MLAELFVKDPDRPVGPVKSGRPVREGLVRISRSQLLKSTSPELLKSSGVFHRPSDTCLCADRHLFFKPAVDLYICIYLCPQ